MRSVASPVLIVLLGLALALHSCSRPCNSDSGIAGGGCGPMGIRVPGFYPGWTPTPWRPWDDDDVTVVQSPTPTATATPVPHLSLCANEGVHSMGQTGNLTCADITNSMDFDWYTVEVTVGDCVDIYLDNDTGSTADLLAMARDADGHAYGMASDFSQLDDEWACSNAPWDGYGCPKASLEATSTGSFEILVAQWAGGGTVPGTDACFNDAVYHLFVAVNGVDVQPTQTADDTPLE